MVTSVYQVETEERLHLKDIAFLTGTHIGDLLLPYWLLLSSPGRGTSLLPVMLLPSPCTICIPFFHRAGGTALHLRRFSLWIY